MESGRLNEAVTAWEHVLRLSPDDPALREELIRVLRAAAEAGR